MENNNMSSDEVVDHFSKELDTAFLNLENALDQAEVTMVQILRIQNQLNNMNAVLMKHVPAAK